jgi:hypothetical protein
MYRILVAALLLLCSMSFVRADDPNYALETRYDEVGEVREFEDVPSPGVSAPRAVCAGEDPCAVY